MQAWFPGNYSSITSAFQELSAMDYFIFLLNKLPAVAFSSSQVPAFIASDVRVSCVRMQQEPSVLLSWVLTTAPSNTVPQLPQLPTPAWRPPDTASCVVPALAGQQLHHRPTRQGGSECFTVWFCDKHHWCGCWLCSIHNIWLHADLG